MEKKTETTIVYWGCVGVMSKRVLNGFGQFFSFSPKRSGRPEKAQKRPGRGPNLRDGNGLGRSKGAQTGSGRGLLETVWGILGLEDLQFN